MADITGSRIDWDRIEGFIGYGNLEAPVVFIGTEEGLAQPDGLAGDLAWRSRFSPVMDVEAAHRRLAEGPTLFSEHPRSQPTWRVMADVMLHFEKRASADRAERSRERRMYRTRSLGRAAGDSLLAELLPYPSQKESAWLYPDRFENREAYRSKMMPERLKLL
jgi:hypothetical protein